MKYIVAVLGVADEHIQRYRGKDGDSLRSALAGELELLIAEHSFLPATGEEGFGLEADVTVFSSPSSLVQEFRKHGLNAFRYEHDQLSVLELMVEEE